MIIEGEEPVGSMGNDTTLAVLSDGAPALFAYFKQLFAQVTNPPIDPIRESIVMSIAAGLGAERNLLEETPEHAHQMTLEHPILRNHELETLRNVSHDVFSAHTIDITWPVAEGPDGMEAALARCCGQAQDGDRRGLEHPHPLGPGDEPRPRADPVSARRRRRSTTTSCATGPACARASCSSPASPARSTTSRR